MDKLTAALLLCATGIAIGMLMSVLANKPDKSPIIEWLDRPRETPAFHLQEHRGPFSQHTLNGRWTIVLFGFLHCPDICPTSLAQLATIANHLKELGIGDEMQFVFVSVDPARDSLPEISQYVRYFHPSMQGVTGSDVQLSLFAGSLGIQFSASAGNRDSGYTVSHSITYSLIDPGGRLAGRFRPGNPPARVARDIAAGIRANQSSQYLTGPVE